MTSEREYLLDASALLAALFNEPGAETVVRIIDNCSIHAINLSETLRKMLQTGVPIREAETILNGLNLVVNTALGAEEAFTAGRLAFEMRGKGLSLGDCVCLSVGAATGQTVVTADRKWSQVAGVKAGIKAGIKAKLLQIR